ncbi:DUF3349 domain-containing protein [Mycobacterium sp. shizuoka-1]|uniref:DUF3349 domain-containing protein n=1 Tax=Mycobacterium sp. shizuoka-1 TaxID=2039281 RepID=UPI000C05ED55|nr:DUF3349 domain-containing protein [Mycobacterium sp. shizuoka-1]GAY14598.1 hypothetical protein MSZK_13240 [Mycobacterium sp. shizuoka-1]
MTKFLTKIVAWIKAGYPDGVPHPDQVPLFALLRRRLSEEEVIAVAEVMLERGDFDHIDIGVLITEITDALPSTEDIDRVHDKLAAYGWPLDDPRDSEDVE